MIPWCALCAPFGGQCWWTETCTLGWARKEGCRELENRDLHVFTFASLAPSTVPGQEIVGVNKWLMNWITEKKEDLVLADLDFWVTDHQECINFDWINVFKMDRNWFLSSRCVGESERGEYLNFVHVGPNVNVLSTTFKQCENSGSGGNLPVFCLQGSFFQCLWFSFVYSLSKDSFYLLMKKKLRLLFSVLM